MVIFAILLFIVIYHSGRPENFGNKKDKAGAIISWFDSLRGAPNYTRYKSDLRGDSNIVEYEDVLRLFQDKNLTMETVQRVI